MELNDFIIILVIILVIFYMLRNQENFSSASTMTTGLYNYFFQSYMNPYPLPLTKFFSNDKQKGIEIENVNEIENNQ